MKKQTVAMLLVIVLLVLMSSSTLNVSAAKLGDKLGDVINTDIQLHINGFRIPCYLLNDQLAVKIGELREYGFEVVYSKNQKSVEITRNIHKKFYPLEDVKLDRSVRFGSVLTTYQYTDVAVKVDGKVVDSFVIKGQVVIYVKELQKFGTITGSGKDVNLELEVAPAGVLTESSDFFEYKYDHEFSGICLTKYSGTKTKLRVPDTVDGIPVVGIASTCFSSVAEVYYPATLQYFLWGAGLQDQLGSLTSVVVPKGVWQISGQSFVDCTTLSSVTLPESLIVIGDGAFAGCISLKSITLPKHLAYIGNRTFQNCETLKSITFPSSMEIIGESAFRNCSKLDSVKIDSTKLQIGDGSFFQCPLVPEIDRTKIKGINPHAFRG